MQLLITHFLAGWILSCATATAKDLDQYTLEDVLHGVLEANGGEESFFKVTNARFRGEYISGDNAIDFVLLKKRPNKSRYKFIHDQNAVETGYNGETAWRRWEENDFDKVELLAGEELLSARMESDFDGPMMGDQQEGFSRKLLGIERVDRVDYFVVEIQSPLARSLHYVDSRTFRQIKTVSIRTDAEGNEVTVTSRFQDMEKHAGIWVATRIVSELPDGKVEELRINEIEMNPGILDMVFEVPQERNPLPTN